MNNEELKAKGEQIFNSSEAKRAERVNQVQASSSLLRSFRQAFNILSNELFQLQTHVPSGGHRAVGYCV